MVRILTFVPHKYQNYWHVKLIKGSMRPIAGGAQSLIAIRVLMGIAQGPMFPACLALLSSWVPLKERSFIVSLTYGGIMVRSILKQYLPEI